MVVSENEERGGEEDTEEDERTGENQAVSEGAAVASAVVAEGAGEPPRSFRAVSTLSLRGRLAYPNT